MEQFSEYEVKQLTGQGECYIHTHPKEPLTQNSSLQLQLNQPILPVVDGATLTYKQDFVSISPAGASVHIYLPPAVKPKEYVIFMIGSGTVTVHADGTDTISGNATKILSRSWSALWIKSDGSGTWFDLESVVGIGSAGTAALPALFFNNDTNTGFYSPGADQLGFSTNGSLRWLLNSSGWLLGYNGVIQQQSDVDYGPQCNVYGASNTAGAAPYMIFGKARGTQAAKTSVQSGDNLGTLLWQAYHTTGTAGYANAASIYAQATGAPSGDIVPTKLVFQTMNTSGIADQMTIDSSGTVSITSGQIKFPATQNASDDANTLDDYEEGTWTPTITAESGTFTTVSASGSYVKIGKLVSCEIDIAITTAGTASGALYFTLPAFTPAGIGCGAAREGAATGAMCQLYITTSGGSVYTYSNGSVIASGRRLRGSFSYISTT